jgi:hypothetical protein
LLLSTFDGIYLLALTGLVGSILYFSFGVAPLIFRVLDAASAARFVRALFPRYYAWGVVSASVALPCLICGALAVPELRGTRIAVQAGMLLASIAILFYCGNILTPRINAARDAGPDQSGTFDRLHKLSVRLNGVVLVMGIALLVLYAVRPAPLTLGIAEMTPQERSAYDQEFSQALDEILRGQALRQSEAAVPRFKFDAEARQELERLVAPRGSGRPATRP